MTLQRLFLTLLLCRLCLARFAGIGGKVHVPSRMRVTGDTALHLRDSLSGKRNTNCDSKWTDIDPDHTMCLEDRGTEVVLDQATKSALVQKHNYFRRQVSPRAGNMPKVVWDDELALVAGKWARQCVVGHDENKARRVPSLPGIHVGQNGAFGQQTFVAGVQTWFNEVADFEYGKGETTEGAVVGHYVQLVSARVQRIGCGQAYCPGYNYTRYYFCNYAIGTYSSDRQTPYAKATKSCAHCPGFCDSSGKLCDCGGKICLNGGTFDISTCSCSCPDIFSGPTCETLTCPSEDRFYCGEDSWKPSACDKYGILAAVKCPYMCGLCPDD